MAQPRIESPEIFSRPPRKTGSEEPVEVRRYLDAIRRSRWLIVAIATLLTGVVVAVSLSLPDRYTASASIVQESTAQPFESQSVDVVTRELATIGQLLTTSSILDAAARN